MTSEHWTHRLSEYLDGELEEAERAACAAHLEGCESCSGTLEELRRLVGEAALLGDAAPDRDLWPEIASRLEPRGEVRSETTASARVALGEDPAVVPIASRRRRVVMTVPQLIAAAIALVLFSVGTARLVLPTGGDGVGPGVARTAAGGAATPVVFAAAYDQAITELEGEFESRRSTLDPETIRVVEENLAIIDRAIAEARDALADDPSSGFLNSHLANAMRRKVDLLRQVASIEQTEI